MGEARMRRVNGEANGHQVQPHRVKRLRVVPNIKLENRDGLVVMMLGDDIPELATSMSPDIARQLAAAIIDHAERLEADGPRIFIP